MQLTKFTHSCVRLDDGDRNLVIDPGVFSEVDEALDGAGAVLITHEHPDHIEVDRVRAALERNSRLQLFGPDSVARNFAGFGDQVVTVEPAKSYDVGGFSVRTFGGQHAVIHPTIPVIANVTYLIEDAVYHPGDSFTVPTAPVSTLLLPINAPWSKASEVVDFAISVRAPRVHQIHDGLINERYLGLITTQLANIAGPHGVEFRPIDARTSVTV